MASLRSSLWRSTRWLSSQGAPKSRRVLTACLTSTWPVLLISVYCPIQDVVIVSFDDSALDSDNKTAAYVFDLGAVELVEIHSPLERNLGRVWAKVDGCADFLVERAGLKDNDIVLLSEGAGGSEAGNSGWAGEAARSVARPSNLVNLRPLKRTSDDNDVEGLGCGGHGGWSIGCGGERAWKTGAQKVQVRCGARRVGGREGSAERNLPPTPTRDLGGQPT